MNVSETYFTRPKKTSFGVSSVNQLGPSLKLLNWFPKDVLRRLKDALCLLGRIDGNYGGEAYAARMLTTKNRPFSCKTRPRTFTTKSRKTRKKLQYRNN